MPEIEKYRPANAEEGEDFIMQWCERCEKWDDGGCPIFIATQFITEEEPNYPSEWRYGKDDEPECSAYQPVIAPPNR